MFSPVHVHHAVGAGIPGLVQHVDVRQPLRRVRHRKFPRIRVHSRDAHRQTVDVRLLVRRLLALGSELACPREQWQLAPKLIALFTKPSHDAGIIQRSIIKFALAAPAGDKNTATFLAKLRDDPKQAERVKDLEQLLELEKPKPADAAPKK